MVQATSFVKQVLACPYPFRIVCHTIGDMHGKRDLVLGLDSGTQSSTAAAFTLDGRLAGLANSPLEVSTPREGWAEQDPREWWHSSRAVIRACLNRLNPNRVIALGVAFQRETFTLLDGKGRPLRPAVLWLDVRAAREAREAARAFGAGRFHRLTGKILDVTCALPRLLWLKRHERRVVERAARWTDVGASLAFSLTGRYATCVSGADTCGLIGLASRDWIEPALKAVRMRPGQFPDLVEPGEHLGTLAREAAAQTGLPAGLPVVAAGGDGQVFPAGMGAVDPYALSLTLGTSIVLGVSSPHAHLSPLYRTLLLSPGSYLLECVLQSGTYLLKWFLSALGGAAEGDEALWERRARAVPPGCAGLITLPHWWGVRFPESIPDMRGITAGWSNNHTRDHLYRSLLEGVAFELKRTLESLDRALPHRLRGAVHAGGGGMKSRLWESILADVLRRPIRRSASSEACALGAAAHAALGVQAFPSLHAAGKAMCSLTRPSLPRRRTADLYERVFREAYLPLLKSAAPAVKALRGIR